MTRGRFLPLTAIGIGAFPHKWPGALSHRRSRNGDLYRITEMYPKYQRIMVISGFGVGLYWATSKNVGGSTMITEQDVRLVIGRVCQNIDANALPVTADFGDVGLD